MYCKFCGEQISEESLFCYKCGGKLIDNSNSEVAKSSVRAVEMIDYEKSDKFKEYLEKAKTLEVNRYTLITAKSRLQSIIDSLGHKREISYPTSHTSEGFSSFWRIFWGLFIIGVIISVCVCGDSSDSVSANIISLITIVLLFFNTELLIGVGISLAVSLVTTFVICVIRSATKHKEYNIELQNYYKKLDEDKKRVAFENEQIKGLREQQNELDYEIETIGTVLERLYALDVVYPKYRQMIPIVTMWQYFDSERCYDFKGSSGAYNLYEFESRQDIIITSLNKAISMLAQIRDNQYALYEAIQESNAIAERISMQNEILISSSKTIEKNSEITANYSKIAAENSSISAYIDLCKLY